MEDTRETRKRDTLSDANGINWEKNGREKKKSVVVNILIRAHLKGVWAGM